MNARRDDPPVTKPLKYDDRSVDDVGQATAQGLMITASAVVMTVKNQLIVSILRDNAVTDDSTVCTLVYEALGQAIREQKANGAHAEELEQDAARSRGRSEHEHDFRRRDVEALRDRRQVYLAVADRLAETRGDRGSLLLLGELAVTRAREEIERAAQTRPSGTTSVSDDPAYASERAERLRRFIEIDLPKLRPVDPA